MWWSCFPVAVYNDPGEMVCMFEGQQGGVTQLMFSPDGSKLYSGGRKVRITKLLLSLFYNLSSLPIGKRFISRYLLSLLRYTKGMNVVYQHFVTI